MLGWVKNNMEKYKCILKNDLRNFINSTFLFCVAWFITVYIFICLNTLSLFVKNKTLEFYTVIPTIILFVFLVMLSMNQTYELYLFYKKTFW